MGKLFYIDVYDWKEIVEFQYNQNIYYKNDKCFNKRNIKFTFSAALNSTDIQVGVKDGNIQVIL